MASTYVEFHRRLGNDPQVGVALAEMILAGGLEVETYRGWYTIMEAPPGVRPPSWAARDAMVSQGVATADDVARWGRCSTGMDEAMPRPRIFAPTFVAIWPPPYLTDPTGHARVMPGTAGRIAGTASTFRYAEPSAGRGSGPPQTGQNDIARSACAAIVRDGLAPRLAEIAAPSTTCSPGWPNTRCQPSTTPRR